MSFGRIYDVGFCQNPGDGRDLWQQSSAISNQLMFVSQTKSAHIAAAAL